MAPSDWLTLSHIELPLGLCPPVFICVMLRYCAIAVTAPVSEDSSGALSVRSDIGTPLWNITLVDSALATFNSAIGCTPFESGHGLSATTIAQARTQVTRRVIDAEGGRDGDTLEDVDEFFDKSDIKQQFELAMRMAEVARSTSEWHRRMTAENLGQHGQVVNLSDLPIGAKAYVYKPPTQQETIARGRKAKHIDHYIGPGTITSHLGTRSVVVTIKDKNGIEREYQRDAGMILLRKPRPDDQDPVNYRERSQGTRISSAQDFAENPLKKGEFVILYLSQIRLFIFGVIAIHRFLLLS